MARLIILLGPVASALGGIAAGLALDHLILNSTARLLLLAAHCGKVCAPAPAHLSEPPETRY
jgi:hypothetical protein